MFLGLRNRGETCGSGASRRDSVNHDILEEIDRPGDQNLQNPALGPLGGRRSNLGVGLRRVPVCSLRCGAFRAQAEVIVLFPVSPMVGPGSAIFRCIEESRRRNMLAALRAHVFQLSNS